MPPAPEISAQDIHVAYRRAPFDLLDKCGATLGNIFTLPLGSHDPAANGARDWVFLTRPEDLRMLFGAGVGAARASDGNRLLFGGMLRPDCLLALDGEVHLHRRRLIARTLSAEALEGAAGAVTAATRAALKDLPRGESVSLVAPLQRIALEGALHTTFGRVDDRLRRRYVAAVETQNGTTSDETYVQLLGDVSEAIRGEIAELAGPDKTAPPGLLGALYHASGADGLPLTESVVHDEALLNLIAGFHTTAATICWAVAFLLGRPEALAELVGELDGAASSQDGARPYLDAVITETLRLAPIMPTAGVRVLQAPMLLGGYWLPSGTVVANCPYLLHRHADLYPDPLSFRPERFLGTKPDPFAWTPFGGGTRRCIGLSLSWREVGAVLEELLSSIALELAGPALQPVLAGNFYVPEGGPCVRLVERLPSPGREAA